jgi:hypothetical protein
MSENFMSIEEGQKDDVMSMLSSVFQDKITRNRSILHSIHKTIYLPVCGKQNIPLRGHTEEKSNFIALINYRAETDQILATHLQNSPPNARYLSPTIKNELIDICGRQLQQVIVSECYDGATNMACQFSGVRTLIQTEIPEAYYVHCYAHCLKLAIVKSCQLPIVRNTIDSVKDVSYAFHYSSKRTGRFKTMLQQADEEQFRCS